MSSWPLLVIIGKHRSPGRINGGCMVCAGSCRPRWPHRSQAWLSRVRHWMPYCNVGTNRSDAAMDCVQALAFLHQPGRLRIDEDAASR